MIASAGARSSRISAQNRSVIARRKATGRDRGGARSRRRREDAAMGGKMGRALRQFDEERRIGRCNEVRAQRVANDDDGPGTLGHGATPLSANSKIAKLRSR